MDSDSGDLSDHDNLGTAETSLAQVLAAPGHRLSLNLSPYKTRPGDCGVLVVTAAEISDGTRDRVTIGKYHETVRHLYDMAVRSYGSELGQEGSIQ